MSNVKNLNGGCQRLPTDLCASRPKIQLPPSRMPVRLSNFTHLSSLVSTNIIWPFSSPPPPTPSSPQGHRLARRPAERNRVRHLRLHCLRRCAATHPSLPSLTIQLSPHFPHLLFSRRWHVGGRIREPVLRGPSGARAAGRTWAHGAVGARTPARPKVPAARWDLLGHCSAACAAGDRRSAARSHVTHQA